MRKLLLMSVAGTALVGVSAVGFASAPGSGAYVGVQAGYASMDYAKNYLEGESPNLTVGKAKASGAAGRIFAGLNFSPYVAMEVGFLQLPSVKFSDITYDGASGLSASFNVRAADLMMKFTAPLKDGFSAYGKVGVGYMNLRDAKVEYQGSSVKSDDEATQYVPAASVGVAYTFHNNVFMDASYNYYFKNGDARRINFCALGIGYRFMAA